ncbi:MAG: ABC transporter permease [Acidimicrobiales bacterium]
MLRYVLVRFAQAVVVLFVVTTVVFLLGRASGDIAELVAPPDAPPETVALIKQNLGLDRPLIVQYGDYMTSLLRGDLGESFAYRRDVSGLIADALPNSILLGACAFVFGAGLGVTIGVVSAMRQHGLVDTVGKGVALAGQSIPSFSLAILLVLVFALRLGWFPPFGKGSASNLVLPAIALGAYPLASMTRLTRSAVIEVLQKDHTLFERSKGVSVGRLLIHTLRNASLPIVTLAGIQLGQLFSGAVIVETIFAWPGVGQMAIQGINSRDYNVVQGVVLVNTALFVGLLFLVDLSYGLLDPRVRRQGRGVAIEG